MTDYREIAESETDPEAPPISALFKALANNPKAMFEGADGAQRLQELAVDTWITTADGPKTYAFAYCTSGDTGFGDTRAGSTLRPTSAARGRVAGTTNNSFTFATGSALSGTWRCMGTFDEEATTGAGDSYMRGATLWARVI